MRGDERIGDPAPEREGADRGDEALAAMSLEELREAYTALRRRFSMRTAELENNERRLATVLETIPDAIVTIDEAGVVLTISSVALRQFGYAENEVLGRNVNMLMPQPYRDAHDGYIRRYLDTGERRIIGSGRLVVGRRRDGTTFPMELYVGEMRLGGQRLFLGAIRDITSRQETERRVQNLQAALLEAARLTTLGEMSTALAHELNQPLSAIMSYLDAGRHLLQSAGIDVPPRVLEMMEKAAGQARRAGDVIQHMRQLARRGETERQVTDINTVVEDGAALASIGVQHPAVDVVFALEGGLPPALVDVTQIQQVVLNLIRNSFEALGEAEAGRIEVRTGAAEPGFLRVVVSDNGPGLAPEVAAQLFQPFVTTKSTGTGIGLSICKSIVESHGGRIAANRAEGGGVRFAFTVPAAPAGED